MFIGTFSPNDHVHTMPTFVSSSSEKKTRPRVNDVWLCSCNKQFRIAAVEVDNHWHEIGLMWREIESLGEVQVENLDRKF